MVGANSCPHLTNVSWKVLRLDRAISSASISQSQILGNFYYWCYGSTFGGVHGFSSNWSVSKVKKKKKPWKGLYFTGKKAGRGKGGKWRGEEEGNPYLPFTTHSPFCRLFWYKEDWKDLDKLKWARGEGYLTYGPSLSVKEVKNKNVWNREKVDGGGLSNLVFFFH